MLGVWNNVKVIDIQDNKDVIPANIYDNLVQLWYYRNENAEGISHFTVDKSSYFQYDESEWTENEQVVHWLMSLGYDPSDVLFLFNRMDN